MNSVDGGFFYVLGGIFGAEALARVPKERASGGSSYLLSQKILKIWVLSSAISYILTSFLRWGAFSSTFIKLIKSCKTSHQL